MISEEKQNLADTEIEKYKTENNFELWQSNGELIKGIPKEKVPLSELAVWIDPLDATQEFTEDLLEFVTVMACIVVRGRPKFGVIYRPFQNQAVWGLDGHGVFPRNQMYSGKTPTSSKTIIVSRSHKGAVEKLINDSLGASYTVESAGGAGYKSLRVVNGTALMYVHNTFIKKWDVCAGDAIVRAAGGTMKTLHGDQLTYYASDQNVVNKDGLLLTLSPDSFKYLAKFRQHNSS